MASKQFVGGWALIIVGACSNGPGWSNLIIGLFGLLIVLSCPDDSGGQGPEVKP